MIQDKLIPTNLEKEMRHSFISYAMAVIIDRALPDVRDGMKPVHRRILFDMSELGMTPDKPYRKSARLVGDVMGKYHPHGDSSVYDAMVRLAQPFNIRYPLVDGQGNFGSVDGDGAAAQRYTEARMTRLTLALLEGIDKDTVDFYPNFDETLQQPTVLPCRIPNLLINGSSGIAVGMATNIPPHNLGESIDGVICMIDNPDCTVDDLMEHIKGPDFPTGGLILGRRGIREAYHTGRGKIECRAKTEIEDMGGGRSRIVVREIPYQVNKAKLVERMAELVHDKKLEGISDIRDESDRNGMRIVIELKRDVYPQVVLNFLFKHTSLQENFNANMLALVDGHPRVLNLREMVYYYLEHQKSVVTRRSQFELDKALKRAHILEGLLICQDNIDEVVHIIRSSKDTQLAKVSLMERFAFSEMQAQAILDMRLGRLTALERDKLEEELNGLQAPIARLREILANEPVLMGVIRAELLELREKFADPRRTELTVVSGEIDVEDLIQEEDMVVTLTHEGYIKRISQSAYKAQNRGGKGITAMVPKEEDYAECLAVCNTHDPVLFFTNRGRVHVIKCYQIPEAGRTARGTAMVNLLQIAGDEKITAMLAIPRGTEDNALVMVTRKGMIKKTSYAEFSNLRKAGLIAIILKEGDDLVGVVSTFGEDELIIGTRHGMCIRFSEKLIRAQGRSSMGVRSIRLSEGDEVISVSRLEEDATVLTITAGGFGKRTDPSEYREQGRNGKGLRSMKLTERTGLLTALLLVQPEEDILLITDDGTIIRTRTEDIRLTGRVAQGVRIMRLTEGRTVVAVARAEREQEEEETTAESAVTAETEETMQNDPCLDASTRDTTEPMDTPDTDI